MIRTIKWFFWGIIFFITGIFLFVTILSMGVFNLNLSIGQNSFLVSFLNNRLEQRLELSEPVELEINDQFMVKLQGTLRLTDQNNHISLLSLQDARIEGAWNPFALITGGQGLYVYRADIQELDIQLERGESGKIEIPKMLALMPFQKGASQQSGLEWSRLGISSALAEDMLDNAARLWAHLPFDGIRIQKLHVRLKDKANPLQLKLENIKILKPRIEQEGEITAQGMLNTLPIDVKILSTFKGKFQVELRATGAEILAKGALFPRIKSHISAQINQGAKLQELIHINIPPRRLSFDMDVAQKGDEIHVSLHDLTRGDSALSGDLIWEIKKQDLTGTLIAKKILLDDFMHQGQSPKVINNQSGQSTNTETSENSISAENTQKKGAFIPDTPLPAFLLKEQFLPDEMDVNVQLKVASLLWGRLNIDDIQADIRADDKGAGVFLDQLLWGLDGKISGQFQMRVGVPAEFSHNFLAQSISIATAEQFIPSLGHLAGNVNANITGKTSGSNLRELAQSFNGDLGVSLYNGHLRIPDGIPTILSSVVPVFTVNGFVPLNCVELGAYFNDGLSNNIRYVAKSDAIIAYGGGKIDLGRESLESKTLVQMDVLNTNLALPLDLSIASGEINFLADYDTLLTGKIPYPVPQASANISGCHADVAKASVNQFTGIAGLQLGKVISNLQNAKPLGTTVQEKIKNKLKEQARQGLGNETDALLKELAGGLSEQQIDNIESAGKSLLNGLFN